MHTAKVALGKQKTRIEITHNHTIQNDTMSTPFQKNLRFLIARNGFTTRKLADVSGLSTAGITNLKNGSRPRDVTVEKLAALFGVDPWLLQFGDLTGGEPPEGESPRDGITPFTRNFRNLMAQRGITVRALADALGMGRASIQALRSGSVPRPATIEKIAEYFNVSPQELAFHTILRDQAESDKTTKKPALFLTNIRKLMAVKGITVRELADAVGLNAGTIQAARTGTIPRQATLTKLAWYFDVPVDDLLYKDLARESSLMATDAKPTDTAPVTARPPVLVHATNDGHCEIPVISASNAQAFLNSRDERLVDYRTCWPGRTTPASLIAAVQMTPEVAGADIVAGDLLFLGTLPENAKNPLVLAEGKTLVVGNLIELPPPLGSSVTFSYKDDEKVVVPCSHVLGEVLCRVRPYVAL